MQKIILGCSLSILLCSASCTYDDLVDDSDTIMRVTNPDGSTSIVRDSRDYSKYKDMRSYTTILRHFSNCKLIMTGMGPLYPEPAQAQSAYRLRIGERFIGIYYYDFTNRVQRKKLKEIEKDKVLYILGNPYRVVINGGYVFIDVYGHEFEKDIIKAINTLDKN